MSLRDLLTRNNIPIADLARAVIQTHGRYRGQPFGRPALSALINHGAYPKTTPKEEVQAQIEKYLEGRGIPLAELTGLWTVAATAAQSEDNAPDEERKTMLPDAQTLSPQAKKAFKLRFNPFEGLPLEDDDYYITDAMAGAQEAFYEASYLRVLRAVIGESGSGKTTLKRRFRLKEAQAVNIVEVLVTAMSDTEKRGGRIMPSTQIHTAIIRQLAGEDARIPGEGQARQSLLKRLLQSSADGGKGTLLVIDEAHDLASATLAHLKRLHELADGSLGIVLLGQPALKAKLTPRLSPEIKEAGQRFPTEFLPALEPEEIAGYLAARLARCKADLDAVFGPDAPQALHDHLQRREQEGRKAERVVSEAYPLAIGNLAVRAINLCARATGGAEKVGGAWIAAAAREA